MLQWAVLVGLAGWAWPVSGGAVVFFAIVGWLFGFVLYRCRPGARWARGLVVAGVPIAIAALFCWGLARDPEWMTPLVMLPAADIGARIAELRERATGIRRSVLAADWVGIDAVGDPGGVQFDVRPLLARIPRAEQREFARQSPQLRQGGLVARLIYVTVVVAVMPLGLFAMLFGMGQELSDHHDDMVGELIAMTAMLSLMTLAWIVLIWWSGATRARVTSVADHLRLFRFGRANGFEYFPGPVAGRGSDTLTRVMRTPRGARPIMIANREGARRGGAAPAGPASPAAPAASAAAVSAGIETTHFGGLCEVELATELPHLWLRSTRHRAPAFSAYTAPDRSQRLSLEGDFDRYFELYCPQGYERDALYLFTPDVMAWLIDDVSGFDVELIDRRLVLRSRGDLVTRDPEDWARLAEALQAVRQRIVQWERWRDDREASASLNYGSAAAALLLTSRAAPGRVGTGGRRLRLGLGAGAIFVGVYATMFVLLTVIANVL